MGKREYPDLPRVYIDLDGPCADFDRHCALTGLTPAKAKMIPGAYKSLPVTPGAIVAVNYLLTLKEIDVWLLSKIPSKNFLSATEKFQWAYKNFPPLAFKLILSPDKGCVGRYQDFLIDDHPEWANANNFPGRVLKFKTMQNNDGFNWNEIIFIIESTIHNRNKEN